MFIVKEQLIIMRQLQTPERTAIPIMTGQAEY